MKIDLHVHSKGLSACATIDEETQIEAAIKAGLDGLAFTNHERLLPPAQLKALNQRYAPFKIFTGIEIQADDEDWLVIGVHDRRLEKQNWRYPNLWKLVRELGGFLILAHPYRYSTRIHADFGTLPPDAIEAASINTPGQQETKIRTLAAEFGLLPMTNSDAHHLGQIGSYYNQIQAEPGSDAELVAHLKLAQSNLKAASR